MQRAPCAFLAVLLLATPGCGLTALIGTAVAISATGSKSSGGVAAPSVEAVSPSSGTHGGGTTVTISGANFPSNATVTIGGIAATNVSVEDGSTLTCTTPRSLAVGPADVIVTNPSGGTGTLAGGYTYTNTAPGAAVSPITSPQSSNIVFGFTLAQDASDLLDVAIEVDPGTGVFQSVPASQLVSGGFTGLSSSPAGTLHTITFDSRAIFAAANATNVRLRVTPTDTVDEVVGTPGVSNTFSVQNNLSPQLQLVQNGDDAYDVVVNYVVTDPNPGDTLSVTDLHWTRLSTNASGPMTLSALTASQGLGPITSATAAGAVKTVWSSLADLGYGNDQLVTVTVAVSDGKNAPVSQTSQPFFVSNGPVRDQQIVPVSGFNDAFAVGDVNSDSRSLPDLIATRAGDSPGFPGQMSYIVNRGGSFDAFVTEGPPAVPGTFPGSPPDTKNPFFYSAFHPTECAILPTQATGGNLDFVAANSYFGPGTNQPLYASVATALTFAGEDGVATGFADLTAHQVTLRALSSPGAGPDFAGATVETVQADITKVAARWPLAGGSLYQNPPGTPTQTDTGNPAFDRIGWFTQQVIAAPLSAGATRPDLVMVQGIASVGSALPPTTDLRGAVTLRLDSGSGLSSTVWYLDPTDMGLLPTMAGVADLLSSSRAALTGALEAGGMPAVIAAPIGSPDLLVVNTGDSSLTFYFQASVAGAFGAGTPPGYASFKLPMNALNAAIPNGDTIGVAIGDLNGDGANDFVVIGQLSQVAIVFLYDTNASDPGSLLAATSGLLPFRVGGFMKGVAFGPTTAGILQLPGFSCKRPAIGDVNGDGRPDIVVPSLVTNETLVFLNDGNLTPVPGAIPAGTPLFERLRFTTDIQPYQTALVDMNGDQRLDIVTPNHFSLDFSVYYQTSPGTLDERFIPIATGQSPELLAVGDFGGLGYLQVAVPFSNDDKVVVYGRSNGSLAPIPGGTFDTSFPVPPLAPNGIASQPFVLDAGDVTGTGRTDILAAMQIVLDGTGGVTGGIELLRVGVGDLAIIQTGTFANAGLASSAGDFDGDGIPDMVLTCVQQSTASITVFKGLGPGPTGLQFSKTTLDATTPRRAKIVDLDGDGKNDLVVTVSGGVDIWWGTGTSLPSGSPTFIDTETAFGTDPVDLAIGDLDTDGRLDLLIGGFVTSSAAAVFQTAPRTFTIAPLLVGCPPTGVTVGDLNGDGLLDAVMCWASLDEVAVYYQNPAKAGPADALLAPVVYGTASTPYGCAVLDVDGDGKNDLVVSCKGANSLNIFLQR